MEKNVRSLKIVTEQTYSVMKTMTVNAILAINPKYWIRRLKSARSSIIAKVILNAPIFMAETQNVKNTAVVSVSYHSSTITTLDNVSWILLKRESCTALVQQKRIAEKMLGVLRICACVGSATEKSMIMLAKWFIALRTQSVTKSPSTVFATTTTSLS